MKTLTILASLVMLPAIPAMAQSASYGGINNVAQTTSSKNELVGHDVTGFSNPYTGPDKTKESIARPPNMHPDLHPKAGGVITDSIKYGPVMVSPFAPASYGIGEKYLSAPDPRYDIPDESGRAAHRDSGGFKLLSLEF